MSARLLSRPPAVVLPPRVSVLLPVHDAAATLPQALHSLAAQSLQDFEVVLVDDGSTDDSVAMARRQWPDDRLRIVAPGRVGLVRALNAGLQHCRAEWVARMDADDIALPERLAAQVAAASATDVTVVSCGVESFAAGPLGEGYRRYDAWLNSLVDHDAIVREIFVESPLAHPSVMFRRSAVLALGGYRDMGWPEDYDLWLRGAAAGWRFAKIPQVLLRWRDHPGRASRQQNAYSADAFLRCKAHHLARGPLAGHGGVIVWGAGRVGRRLGRYLREAGIALRAWIDIDPRKIGRVLYGAPVLAPAGLGQHRDARVVACVGSRGARQLIRSELVQRGWREGASFWCAA